MEISFLTPRWARLIIFTLLVAFMAGGPFYRQALGGQNLWFRPWIMFSNIGLHTIDAKFTHIRDDGSEVVLIRQKVLAEKYRKKKKKTDPGFWTNTTDDPSVWLLSTRTQTELAGAKQLCKLLGSGSIRINSRIAEFSGWVPRLKGKIVSCSGGAGADIREK